jgi:hypothetical protein
MDLTEVFLFNNYRNYNNYVSDNLDSWCCALTFDLPEGKMEQSIIHKISAKV